MNSIELDVRPIPQLYGTSYHHESKGFFSTLPSSVVRGSCLTASLEMMVDWLKGANRTGAYSTFRNASFLNKHAKQGHPNGDELTHLMWNQATLHFTIYCNAQRLIELLDFFDMPTRTISLTPPSRKGRLEAHENVMSRSALKQRIVEVLLDDKKPLIALVDDMRICSERHHQEVEDITPFPDMPLSCITSEKTPTGHAVVLSGIDLDNGHLLVLDPSPSIELENHPERFHTTDQILSNPNNHRHKVDLDDFVGCLQSTRSLITFDVDPIAELIKSHIKQIVEIGRRFGINLYGAGSWDNLPGTHDGAITSLDANTCIEFADHDFSNDHISASINSANRMDASLLILLCESEIDAASLKNKIESNFTPKLNDDDPDVIVISVSDLEPFL
jgi:hypothetical protein